ncbi:MAG: glycosyltransferase [bacterium]|nr:glycosyltransferase [bacterium]
MKVLMISSDRNILVPGSAVSERMKEYGNLVEELHIVLMSDARHKLKDKQLSNNVWVYTTNSPMTFMRPFNAARLGRKVVFDSQFVRGRSIITTQDPFECGWAGLRIKKRWKIPLEVQLHTDPFSPYFSGLLNQIRKIIARRVLRNANSVRVVTLGLKTKVSAFTSADISVLPIYVDRKHIEEAKISFDLHTRYPWHFILLAVSRLAPEKNLSLALRVLVLVRERFPDTGLVIVGSGPEEGRLKALTQKLKLVGAVEFVGWQDDLTSFYKTANVFIQTSIFEGYGLSLVEAGLSDLPVVTTPVGIAQELENGKDAYIYPANNIEAFANGIVDLIENNQKRENLRLNMKQTLEVMLISKGEYLKELKSSWEKTALKVN